MRLPWGIYYREPHNSCCALAYQLLCECPSAVVRSSSTCCAVSLYTEMRLHLADAFLFLHILHRQSLVSDIEFLEFSCSLEEMLGFIF